MSLKCGAARIFFFGQEHGFWANIVVYYGLFEKLRVHLIDFVDVLTEQGD